jgi:hypothetical protein
MPCAIWVGDNDSVADEHGEKTLYWAEAVVSLPAVLAASRTQTPKYSVPAAAPVLFQWYVGLVE